MAKKKAEKKEEQKVDIMTKRTALIRLADSTLFVGFDNVKISGTLTQADGKTYFYEAKLEEVD